VLELHLRVLGAEHSNTVTSMNNLAETLRAQGDLAGARGLQQQVLDLRRRALGMEHPDTLLSMNNLAETVRAQGDLAGARGLQEQVLELYVRTLGVEHPHTLRSMNNLAETVRAQGDLAGARGLQEQMLELYLRTLGMEHPHTLRSMNNLALTLQAQGDLAGARGLQEQALEDLRASTDWEPLIRQFGERVFGFEHRTFSESPIDNALFLAHTLPAGALSRMAAAGWSATSCASAGWTMRWWLFPLDGPSRQPLRQRGCPRLREGPDGNRLARSAAI
jgi:tetratricopeptide (TPR) repeat protein